MQAELTLSNDIISVTMAPDFGARVTGLTDLRSGRNWLVDGAAIGGADEWPIFGSNEAKGWDECFPTVAPCVSPEWARDLRDHGDIWGRATKCRAESDSLTFIYLGDRFKFKRKLVLHRDCLNLEYKVTNISTLSIPYLWSQHCLLATSPKDRLFINGASQFRPTAAMGLSAPDEFEWPHLSAQHTNLQNIESIQAKWALKAYAPIDKKITAGVHGEAGSIVYEWTEADAPYVGLWLDYGAWPDGDPVHQVAIEATTAPVDHLADALVNSTSRWLTGGETRSWTMSIYLTNQSNSGHIR